LQDAVEARSVNQEKPKSASVAHWFFQSLSCIPFKKFQAYRQLAIGRCSLLAKRRDIILKLVVVGILLRVVVGCNTLV